LLPPVDEDEDVLDEGEDDDDDDTPSDEEETSCIDAAAFKSRASASLLRCFNCC
jgi:hypothetical protein